MSSWRTDYRTTYRRAQPKTGSNKAGVVLAIGAAFTIAAAAALGFGNRAPSPTGVEALKNRGCVLEESYIHPAYLSLRGAASGKQYGLVPKNTPQVPEDYLGLVQAFNAAADNAMQALGLMDHTYSDRFIPTPFELYHVQPGDNVTRILAGVLGDRPSDNYVELVAAANGMKVSDFNRAKAGQTIKVPGKEQELQAVYCK